MDKKIKLRSNVGSRRAYDSYALDQMVTGQEEKTNSHRNSNRYNSSSYSAQHTTKRQTASMSQNQGLDEEDQEVEVSDIKKRSAEEVSQFINKLIAKNKISSKNAFDVPMIHLDQTKDFRADLNQNTWKNLSSTLENDYKIYGYRVDATHTITYKMVQSIARHQANTSQAISDYKQQKQEQKKYKLDLASTSLAKDYTGSLAKFIQKNVKILNVTQLQSFFSYNPGLERTKRKFDQQGLNALLLNNIEIRQNGELRLDEQHEQQNESKIQSEDKNFNEVLDCNQLFKNVNLQSGNEEIGKCFQEIYQLNINSGGADKEEVQKLNRLYRIVSGEQRQQKKRKKKQEQILELNLNSIPEDIQNQNQIQMQKNQNINQPMQIQPNTNPVLILPQNTQVAQNNQIIENIIQTQLKNMNNNEVSQNPQVEKQNSEQQKQLRMKKLNEGLKQLNLDQISEQFQAHQQSHLDCSYLEVSQQKMRNIDEYISIKQKKQRRTKIKKELTSQEIAKKLFNRKIKTKKNNQSEAEIPQQKKQTKIKFKQTNKKIYKRGSILKKSVYQERIFNKLKHAIKDKIQFLQLQKLDTQNKKTKNKKRHFFDLPIYKTFSNQVNLVQELDHFQQKSKDKNFVFQIMPNFIQQVKQQKRQRFQQQKLKLLQLQQNQMITVEGQQILNECQQIEQFDLLKMGDYMDKIRKTYNVTIKDTKDKMQQILLKNQDAKSHTYDFRNLYEQYYHSEGFISPALCFLTVLHLANENNLELQGNQEGENFNIRNLENCLPQNKESSSKKKKNQMEEQSKIEEQISIKTKKASKKHSNKTKTKKLMNYEGSQNSESIQIQE